MKKVLIGCLAIVVGMTAILWWALPGDEGSDASVSAASVKQGRGNSTKRIRDGKKPRSQKVRKVDSAKRNEKPSVSSDDDDNLSPADRKIADDLQAALDENDFNGVSKVVKAAMASGNPELLKKAIEACKWFGPKALVELTALAAKCSEVAEKTRRRSGRGGRNSRSASSVQDGGMTLPPDGEGGETAGGADAGGDAETAADVAEAAEEALQMSMDAIEEKLGEIEDDATKAKLIGQYMVATSDENTLVMLEGQLNTVFDDKIVMEAAIDVIENGSAAAAEHAKAAYEFQTGEAYTSREAAQQWLDENYTPPDAD